MPALQRPHFELTLSVLAIILYCFTNVFYPESYFSLLVCNITLLFVC